MNEQKTVISREEYTHKLYEGAKGLRADYAEDGDYISLKNAVALARELLNHFYVVAA